MEPITAQEPLAQTADLAAENLDRLRQLFPDAVTEDGVDLEVLRQLLGGAAATGDERYGLHWHGKRQARQLALMPSTGTLRPAPTESENWDTTQNLMIEGDNLEVLKLLQKSYAGQVKLIYIDPPYNTGKDFVYPDNYKNPLGNYLELTGQVVDGEKMSSNTDTSGRFHTDWLNMMYPRLKVARNLLREDGVIFVSIDDAECHHTKELMAEIFGEENFVGQWNWFKSATPPNLSKKIKKNIEYVICYQKGRNNEIFKGVVKTSKSDDPLTKPQNTIKDLTFNPGWLKTDLADGTIEVGIYGTDKYPNELLNDLIIKDGTNVNKVVFRNKFVWTQGKLEDEINAETRVSLSKNLVLSYKKSDYGEEVPPNFIDISVGVDTTENAGRQVASLLDNVSVFDYPKPVSLITYLMNFCVGANDTILDFFAGSGTTGHAVMAQNAADDGNWRYILVQLPEPLDPAKKEQKNAADYCDTLKKPRTIAELTKERLRRAALKVKTENPEFKGDLGFRVYRLASSNIKAWRPEVEDLRQTLIEYEDNLDTKRTDEDLLTELQLKLGLPLTTPIEVRELPGGHKVHSLGAGTLLVRLSRLITKTDAEPLATAISDWHQELAPAGDSQVLFRDSAFAGDEAKTNLAAQLRQRIERVQVRSL